MSDDLTKRGKQDRDRVSAHEPYEVRRLAEKFKLPIPAVQVAIQTVGPMRRNVEAYLERQRPLR